MTDKEIIIDGVDVSKCIHIDNWKHCNCCNDLIKTIYPKASQCLIEEDLRCEIYSNCYYKQLKRKEQECEELKEDRERWKSNFNGKVSAIEELLQQLDKLKAENKHLNDLLNQALKELEKTRETLTEIKEIVEKDFRHTAWEEYAKQLKQILQKISECEVENEI